MLNMKKRSMLGRRQSRMLQSPVAPSSTLKPPPFARNAARTPQQSSGLLDNPFRTPSVNGSLSDVANEDPWSVFKCVRNGIKSPEMVSTDHDMFRNPQDGVNKRESALKNNYNRRKAQKHVQKMGGIKPSSSTKTKNFAFPVYKHQRNSICVPERENQHVDQTFATFAESDSNNHAPVKSTSDEGILTRPNGFSSKTIKPFELFMYKNQRNDVSVAGVAKTNGEPESTMPAVRDNSTEARNHSEHRSQSPWECQDIRNLSPPWSNGLNTLNDFNLLITPQLSSRVTSSPVVTESRPVELSNSLAYPLEATVLENTVVQTKVTPQAKEPPTSKGNKDEKLDLKSALSDVSLGVNSLELLDKHGMGGWSTTSWASRTPLQKLPEEPGELEVLEKENLPPSIIVTDHPEEERMEEEQSQPSDDTFLSPSQGSSSASRSSGRDMKKHLEKLVRLNSRIEEAEEERYSAEERIRQLEEQIRVVVEERRAAEDKRRKLESERKVLNYELLEEMSQAPSIFTSQPSKRRKLGPPSAKKEPPKKGPSFVASKLLKRDFIRTPVRTPRRSLANTTNMSMNSFLNPFTPKTLRKNINEQYDQIFGN